MEPIIIKNLTIGIGSAAVCAPFMGKTSSAVCAEIELAKQQQPDLIEWRADYFADIKSISHCTDMLQRIHNELPDIPVLFTLRAASEGGAQNIPCEIATQVYKAAIQSGHVDLIDIEMANDAPFIRDLMDAAAATNVKVILSHHNFHETPTADALRQRFSDAQSMSPDIIKVAVMPKTTEDVWTLLHTAEAFRHTSAVPLIAISMGQLGAPSRIIGGSLGSAITYASLDDSSATAPGQFDVIGTRKMMRMFGHAKPFSKPLDA